MSEEKVNPKTIEELENNLEQRNKKSIVKVEVEVKGSRITFKNKEELIEAWEEFRATNIQNLILSSGIQGNRAGLSERIEVYTEFLHNGKDKNDFYSACALKGYSADKRAELWNDFNTVWLSEFKKSLMPKTKGQKDESITI